MSFPRLLVVAFAALSVSSAFALDQSSLRLAKESPTSVVLSWSDPDPTVFCIVRDPSGVPTSLIASVSGLSYVDAAPSAPLLYYSVDEPASGACGVVPPPCASAAVLDCGGSASSANDAVGSTNGPSHYACGVTDATGPEMTYTFAPVADARVTASLTGLTADLDIFILADQGTGCDATTCIDGGADSITWDAVAGMTYYIVVDGRVGAVSPFTVSLTCPPPPPPTCASVGNVTCAGIVTARNDGAGSTNRITSYPNCTGRDASGPEIAYTFTASDAGLTTAALANAAPGLNLYVLSDAGAGCDPAQCISSGTTTASFTAAVGATYYVVVEGSLGAVGSFDLSMSCPSLPTSCAPIGLLDCGSSVFGSTTAVGTSNSLTDYPGCFSPGYTGREAVYEFDATADDTLTAQISNAPAGLDVIVLMDGGSGCETATCIAAGDTSTTFPVTAGSKYFVVIDGPAPVTGSFQLDVACAGSQCLPTATLLCGMADASNNAWPVFTDVNDAYPCAAGLDETGPEYSYRFTATQSGSVTATLSNLTVDLDVFVLEPTLGCSPDACVAFGDNGVTFPVTGGQTYNVVVDGRAGVEGFFRLDLACAIPPSSCDPHGVIACGDLVGNDSAAGRRQVSSWPCAPGLDESGPEYVFQYSPTESARVRVVMDLNIEDLDLFIIEDQGSGCQPAGCIATGDTEVSFDAVAGKVYYVIVDGRAGASDIFRLWMDCERVPGACHAAAPIGCGDTVSGRNDAAGSTDAIDSYPACIVYPEDGPEFTYEFVPTVSGMLHAEISNFSTDLDVFVLQDSGGGCNAGSCIGAGNTLVDVAVTAGTRYFIIVEGFAGNVGSYDLSVTCN